jgi:hypothetical protein
MRPHTVGQVACNLCRHDAGILRAERTGALFKERVEAGGFLINGGVQVRLLGVEKIRRRTDCEAKQESDSAQVVGQHRRVRRVVVQEVLNQLDELR